MTLHDVETGASRRAMDWEGFFRRFREPDFVPGFQIENKLGGGVFGEVYRAKKLSIGKAYAIKFLKLADEGARDDLFRELQSVEHFAQVDHPHLVSIEDKGEVLGIPFIVMNYAGDETLKVRLAQGPLSPEEACPLFRQILEGVGALHLRSIIHFDLKPANVFLKGPVARVGDYGLSKLVTESARTLSMGRGTPAYMAPEMLHRKGDSRSDVYSLGAIFFEMLSGEPPFRGDSEWEVLKKHEIAPLVFPASLPESLRPFVEGAMQKDPDRRYPDGGAMLRAFDVAVSGHAAGPARGGAIPPLRGGEERNPPSATGASAVGRRVGEVVGKVAADASLERVKSGVQEILDHVRRETTGAVDAAKEAFRRARADGRPSVRAPAPPPPLPPRAPRAKGVLYRAFTAPFRFVRWIFRNLLAALLTLFILFAFIGAAEFVLRSALA